MKWHRPFISHTHWDREWYQTFQDYRARLVGLFDELIGFMEKNPAFKYYHLDGQTIVLEDYLEARPEIDNTARDHVLKALFPVRSESWESFADSMFDVVQRDIRPPTGVVFEEPWQENRPLESFVGIGDRHRGLVVFATGLHEGGVTARQDAGLCFELIEGG